MHLVRLTIRPVNDRAFGKANPCPREKGTPIEIVKKIPKDFNYGDPIGRDNRFHFVSRKRKGDRFFLSQNSESLKQALLVARNILRSTNSYFCHEDNPFRGSLCDSFVDLRANWDNPTLLAKFLAKYTGIMDTGWLFFV